MMQVRVFCDSSFLNINTYRYFCSRYRYGMPLEIFNERFNELEKKRNKSHHAAARIISLIEMQSIFALITGRYNILT